MKKKKIWMKGYQGPFTEGEAKALAEDLAKAANPEKNMIYGAKIRQRKKAGEYDVMILTEKSPMLALATSAAARGK